MNIGSNEARLGQSKKQNRALLLQTELTRFLQVVTKLMHPQQVFLFGSFAQGKVKEWSDLDLVVVTETKLPFYDRAKEIYKEMHPRVGIDVLVYTPGEWAQLQEKPFIKNEIIGKGKLIYGQQ